MYIAIILLRRNALYNYEYVIIGAYKYLIKVYFLTVLAPVTSVSLIRMITKVRYI